MVNNIVMYIYRQIEKSVQVALQNNPVVALLGPRQCGKSTMVKHLMEDVKSSVYLDLERPSDLARLEDPEWFLESQKDKLICIDEIQRRPDLFPLLRSLVDEWGKNGSFLILGSASSDLIRQSSETLAGRINYKRLTPFLREELEDNANLEQYIARGGFPRSYLSSDNNISYEWRENFITTFLERDLLQISGFSVSIMRRLWTMLAYNNGQIINFSSLGNSLNVSHSTIKNYIDLLEGTFMLEILPPYISNLGKRMVKSPKVYITDTGVATTLIGLSEFNQISGHPVFGSLWETLVLANLRGLFPNAKFSYYRTSNGSECDIVMEYMGKIVAVECKASKAPSLSRGNFLAFEDIKPSKIMVVAPVNESWSMRKDIKVIPLKQLSTELHL
jgi:uncharacterized protein